MFANEKNNLENLNVNEYLKVFPGTATQYLDWKFQQLWFYQVYPEGAIITDEPQPDAFKTPDTWVCTTRVYLTRADRLDNLPAIQRSAKRGPKNSDQDTEEVVDTYTLSIIASISSALTALGFGPAILTNAEKEKMEQDLLGIPAAVGNSVPTIPATTPVVESNPTPVEKTVTPVEETPVAPTTEAASVTSTPRRGRPTKAEMEARAAAKAVESAEKESAPVVETPVTPTTETIPVAESVTSSAPVEAATEVPSAPMFASLEEARATKCTYRNFKDITIGEIWDAQETNRGYKSFIEWCTTSDRAPLKCPQEIAALNYIKANS